MSGRAVWSTALLGFQRAIVFDLPGTTRDIVTAITALDGWPVEFSDTAGLRASDDPLEAAGVERATAQAAAADCLLLAFDASQPWTIENQKLLERWPAAIVVHNKSDLGLQDETAPQGLRASALCGQGIEDVAAAILSRLITNELAPGDAMPFTDEQVAALQSAENALRNGNLDAARSYFASNARGITGFLFQTNAPVARQMQTGKPANNGECSGPRRKPSLFSAPCAGCVVAIYCARIRTPTFFAIEHRPCSGRNTRC